MTELFAFGGYSPLRRRALNDLHLLTVEYDNDKVPWRYVWTRPDVQVIVSCVCLMCVFMCVWMLCGCCVPI